MLTPETGGVWLSKELLTFILIGTSFFVVGIVTAALISGHKLVEVIKQNTKVTAALLFLALAIPVTMSGALRTTQTTSQASTSVEIQKLSTESEPNQSVRLTFKTTEPALVFLEYQDNQTKTKDTLEPVRDLSEPTMDHEFVIKKVGPQGGSVVFVVNGKRYLIDGKAFPIVP